MIEGLFRDRDRLLTGAALLTASAALWAAMSLASGHHGHEAASGMDWTGLAAPAAMWTSMMAAMMLPSVLPWAVLVARASPEADRRGRWFIRTGFLAGYVSVWTLFALAAAVLQWTLQLSGWLDAGRLERTAGGLLLIAAGLFQISPFKAACLRHCRSPLSYLLTRWRAGSRGAYSMGWRHGWVCLGCCWALMLLSFALGVMNWAWMGVLTVFVCVEKMAPAVRLTRILSFTGLLAGGATVLLR